VHAVFQQLATNSLYLQMQWYANGDLQQWLEVNTSAKRPIAACKQIIADMLLGVAHLREHDVVHCDLKPGNIFLTAGGHAVIGDFDGIRNTTTAASTTVAHQSTIGFVAPEVVSGEQTLFTAACDMYSCGIILRETFDGVLLDGADTTKKQYLINALTSKRPENRPTADTVWQNRLLQVQHASLDTNKQCAVCGEIVGSLHGLECDTTVGNKPHFTCDECVDQYVAVHTGPESAPYLKLAQARGHMDCPIKPCASNAFSSQALALHITSAVHATYMAALSTGNEALLMPGLQRDFDNRLAALREQLQKAQVTNAIDEAARQAELHITGDLLTLKCPRCRTAFYDFEHCFALNCGKCSTWFCAWSLTDCGNSQAAHAHVRACADNKANGNYYGTIEQFQQSQTERRRQLIIEYITTLPADVQVAVRLKVNIHLRDFGVHV
jgi:serine/threonine protein kinase